MNLSLRKIKQSLGSMIHGVADRFALQAASAGIDPDEAQWQRITRSSRDLTPIDQDRMIEIAYHLVEKNPLANLISRIKRDFVIGDGASLEAEDKTIIQPVLDVLWHDPVNDFKRFQFQLTEYLGVQGELFLPVFINEFDGSVRLGWVDSFEVQDVLADKQNRRILRQVVLKPGASPGATNFASFTEKKIFDVVNVDTEPLSSSFGYRIGTNLNPWMLVHQINCPPGATRGRSDFLPVADMLDAWDQATFNDLERAALMLNFIWDVKLTGKSDEQIKTWLRENGQAPRPGSVRAHNEGVEWNAVAPDMKINETRALSDGIRKDVLGTQRLSDFFAGRTDSANRASSENLELPILQGFAARQRELRNVFAAIADFAIDQNLLRRRPVKAQVEAGKISRKFDVKMRELSTRDISRVTAGLSQSVAALDLAVERKWITQATAARAFAALLSQLGVEYDSQQEMEAAQQEAEANQFNDPAGADLKAARLQLAATRGL